MGHKDIVLPSLVVLATVAFAAPAMAGGRTIKLVATTQSANINAGVNSQSKLRLRTPAGRAAGSATWDCFFPTPGGGNGTEVCTDTYKLHSGEVLAHYTFNVNRGNGLGRHRITSGTGAFKHAHGSVTTKIAGQDTFAIAIRLN